MKRPSALLWLAALALASCSGAGERPPYADVVPTYSPYQAGTPYPQPAAGPTRAPPAPPQGSGEYR